MANSTTEKNRNQVDSQLIDQASVQKLPIDTCPADDVDVLVTSRKLLGIDIERSHEFEREISRGCEGIKPGWVRVNFNYFISEMVFEFILDAVDLVATEGLEVPA